MVSQRVENLSFHEALNGFRKDLSEFQLNEDFLRSVLSKTKGSQHTLFLDLVIERYEKEIELLQSQILLYDFRDPEFFFQNIPSLSYEEVRLQCDLHIGQDPVVNPETKEVATGFVVKDTVVLADQGGLEKEFLHNVPIDRVADYLELVLNSKYLTYYLSKHQIHEQRCMYAHKFVIEIHDLRILLALWTISQSLQFLLQFLKWLHWLFHIN